jgi:hypothetical protein
MRPSVQSLPRISFAVRVRSITARSRGNRRDQNCKALPMQGALRTIKPSDYALASWLKSTALDGTIVEMVCLYTICVVALFSTMTY